MRASGGVSVSVLGSTLYHVASQTSGMGCSMAYGSAADGSDDALNAATGMVVSRELSVSSTHIGPRPHCLSKILECNWFPGLAVACGRSGRRVVWVVRFNGTCKSNPLKPVLRLCRQCRLRAFHVGSPLPRSALLRRASHLTETAGSARDAAAQPRAGIEQSPGARCPSLVALPRAVLHKNGPVSSRERRKSHGLATIAAAEKGAVLTQALTP